jgi:hypothetical protein
LPIGDVDGNGVIDFATGHANEGSRGSIVIDFKNARGKVIKSSTIAYGERCFVGDLAGGEEFGRSLCAPGDVNGDGVPDLLVGSKSGVWTLFLASDGSVMRHEKLEDGPRDLEDSTHFGDRLALLPRTDPNEPLRIACAGTLGSGEKQLATAWSLTLGSDGILRAR